MKMNKEKKNKFWKFLLSIGLVCFHGKPLFAEQVYEYHPNSTLALGRGFEPNTLGEPRLNCLEFKESFDISHNAATKTQFKMKSIHSTQQLKESLGVDFKLDARYINSTGSVYFNLDKQSNFSSQNINILISASSEYGTKSMINPQLQPHAQMLIKNGKHDMFRSECGSHLVTNAVYGVKVGVLLTLHNISKETSNGLKSGFNFGYDTGAMDIDLKSSLNQLVQRASSSNSLSVSIYSVGSTGVDNLGDIVKVISNKENALDNIQKELGRYFHNFTRNNSVPIRFMSKPFGFGFEDKYENLWKTHYERKIQRIAEAYRKLKHQVVRVRAIENQIDLRYLLVSSTHLDQLIEDKFVAEDYLDFLANLHRSCQYDVYSQTQPDISNDDNPKPYCQFERREVPYIDLPKTPDFPVLTATSSKNTTPTYLTITGVGLQRIQLLAVLNEKRRILKTETYNQPEFLIKQDRTFNIQAYWGTSDSIVNGNSKGYLIIDDFFGRQIIYQFHHAGYSGLTEKPLFEEFTPSGIEVVLD